MGFVASWAECFFRYPNVKIEDPNREELRAWLYALLKESQQAFSLLFPHPPKGGMKEAVEKLVEGHEKGRDAYALAKAYYYAERAEWPSLPVKGEPFSQRGAGVVSTIKPWVRKIPCGIPKEYAAAFAARVSEWAVSQLRELEGIEKKDLLPPKEALGNPLLSKQPMWITTKALAKAYPEAVAKMPKGRRPKG